MEPQKLPDPAYPARKNHVLPSPNVGKLWRTPWLWLKLWDVGNHIAWVDLARNKPTWLGQKKSFSPDGLTDRQGSLAVLNTSILGLTVLNRKVFTIFWGTTITHKPDSSCEPSMGLRHREWCTQWPRPLLWVPNTMRHPPSNGFSSKKPISPTYPEFQGFIALSSNKSEKNVSAVPLRLGCPSLCSESFHSGPPQVCWSVYKAI